MIAADVLLFKQYSTTPITVLGIQLSTGKEVLLKVHHGGRGSLPPEQHKRRILSASV